MIVFRLRGLVCMILRMESLQVNFLSGVLTM